MSLKEKAVKGVKWTTVSTVILTIVQVLKLALLTRLLEKSDFGLIAIASMVIAFTDIFSEIGLTVAIIHKQNITEKQYSSVYWMNIMLSIGVFCILWALSPLISSFYDEPLLKIIIPLLGIQILFHGIGKMFQTIKTKNLEYSYISKVNIITVLLGFFITVFLAICGWGIYSLVIGQLVQIGLAQGVYAIEGLKIHKILFHFNYQEISDFLKIGFFRFGSQILDFISSKIDIFLIGKFFGMDDLGIYNLGKDLMMRPYMMINMLVNSVASSAFAQIQTNIVSIKTNFLKLLSIISALSIPFYMGIFIFADDIVGLLYSESFSEVAVIIRIFTFVGIECAISSQGSILQVSMGRTDVGFKWTIIRIIMSTGVILAASGFDIYVVAYGQLLVSVASLFVFWAITVKPIVSISLMDYVNAFLKSLIITIFVSLPFILTMQAFLLPLYLKSIIFVVYFLSIMIVYYLFQKPLVEKFYLLLKNGNK
jgi:O-antigen/teichoic acid export membrane protein